MQTQILELITNNQIEIALEKYSKLQIDIVLKTIDLNKVIEQNKIFEYKEKRNDYFFKKNVIQRFQKCIISGNHKDECEVAHIFPFSKCNGEYFNWKYDEYNGLLLSANLHKLYDKGIFRINPETFKIEVKEDCKKENYSICQYDGNILNLHENHKKFLKN